MSRRGSHFLGSRLMDRGEIVSFTRRPPSNPWYSVLFEAESTPGPIVLLGGLGTLKKSSDVGNRTRDLPASNIVLRARR
jgi:hypothetical protein